MRIWSLHPCHLDRIGLVACWRETLLAQAVLTGRTPAYRHHPQPVRFRNGAEPLGLIGAYLTGLTDEASRRGYRFDETKIDVPGSAAGALAITRGQLEYEWGHLGAKLALRSPADVSRWRSGIPIPHPLFEVVPGDVEDWERR